MDSVVDHEMIESRINDGYYERVVQKPVNKFPIKPHLSSNSIYYEQVMKEYNDYIEEYREELKKYREKIGYYENKFEEDIKSMILSRGISKERANMIYHKAYGRFGYGHFREILNEVEYLLDFFKK